MAAIKLKVEKRNVGFGTDKKEMYITKADRGSVYELDDIAHQVALESGVNERQFKAAVGCLVDAMILFLKGGHGVSLKDFGTFLPEVKSLSSENPDEVGVRRLRVSFRPHKALWEAVGDINYETENEYARTSASGDNDDADDTGSDDTTEPSDPPTGGGGGGETFT